MLSYSFIIQVFWMEEIPLNNTKEQISAPIWSIILAVFFGNFMSSLSSTSINVALPVFMKDFNAPLNTVQWMMSGFILATGVIAPVIGFLGDRISYKRLYVMSLIGFTLSSALCVMAWNIGSLITFRIIQGVFTGMILPTTMTIIYQTVPREKQAGAIGMWSVASMLAPAFGPTLGGWLTESFGWEALFIMNIPLGVVAIFFAQKYIPFYKLASSKKLDLIGFITVIIGTSAVLTAFSESHAWGWTSLKTLSLLFGGIFVIAYFVRRTLRAATPLLNLTLFRNSKFTYSLIINCAITIALYSGTLLVPIYMQDIKQANTLHTGLIMLPGTLAMALMSMVVGRMYDRLGPFKLILAGGILLTGATWMLSYLDIATGTAFIIIWIAVRYIGIALSYMPVTNASMTAVSSELTGQASALLNWIRQGTAALSVSVFSTILSSREASHFMVTHDQLHALTLSVKDLFVISTILAAIAIPLTFLIRARKAKSLQPEGQQELA